MAKKKRVTSQNIEDNSQTSNTKQMGIGPKGKKDLCICRKFRWTLDGGESLPEHFMNKVDIQYGSKTITFEYMDVLDKNSQSGIHALVWANNLQNTKLSTPLKFTTYDGCGNELYSCLFSNLKLVSHSSDFDYASSDPSVQRITVSYSNLEFKTPYIDEQKIQQLHWELSISFKEESDSEEFISVCVEQRPSLEIAASEFNHMNSKIFMPGKAKWNPLLVQITSVDKFYKLFGDKIERLSIPENSKFRLVLKNGQNGIETWYLENAWFNKLSFGSNCCEIMFNNVRYFGSMSV